MVLKRKLQLMLAVMTATTIWGSNGEASVYVPNMPDAGSLAREQQDKEALPAEEKLPKAAIDSTEKERPDLSMPDDVKIKVSGFKITGQDIYADETLQALVAEYQGKLVTFKDLQAGADKITAYFRKHGYLMARCYIPAQKISGGVVEYSILVGKLDKVEIVNRTSIRQSVMEREIAFLKPGDYLTRQKLERAVWLLSDLAGAEAKATLAPGTKTGTVVVKIEMSKYGGKCGLISGDNYGNRYTGYNSFGLSYDFLNPAHLGDQLSVAGSTTGSQLYNYGVNYILPTGKDGLRLSLGYNSLAYELGDVYEGIDACGTSRTASLGFDYAIKRSQLHNLYAGLRYEHNALKDEIRLYGSDVPKHSDGVVLSLYGDDMQGKGAFSWRVDYKWGNLSFENDEGYLQGALSQTKGNFHKLHFNLLQQQRLGRRFNLLLSARGQIASSNLDSSEHFSLGGASGVRAYPASEASGDIGYLLRGELRYAFPSQGKDQWQLAAYIDHGGVKINKHDDGRGDNRRFLQGAGLGVIYSRREEFFLRADYAWILGAEKPQSDTSSPRGRFWLRGGLYF